MVAVVAPTDSKAALVWIKRAMIAGRYITTDYSNWRINTRIVPIADITKAILFATNCEVYAKGNAKHGGTCWRVNGTDTQGKMLGVGVEAYWKDGEQVVIVTTFRKGE